MICKAVDIVCYRVEGQEVEEKSCKAVEGISYSSSVCNMYTILYFGLCSHYSAVQWVMEA